MHEYCAYTVYDWRPRQLLIEHHSTRAFKAQPIRKIDRTAKPPDQLFALSCFFTMHKHCLEDLN